MMKIRSVRRASRISLHGACAICAMLPVLGGTAFAQAPSRPQASSNDGLQDIVVTAQRREEPSSRVPVPIQAVDAATLERKVVTDTRSLLSVTPSLNFQQGISGVAGGFIMRGISSTSTVAGLQQSTAMVIDGVPLVRASEFNADLGDVQRVEVLRGPQGTLFGKNATAGVISIVTENPSDVLEGKAAFTATNDDEQSVRAMVNVPLSDRLRVRVNGYYDRLSPLFKNRGPAAGSNGFENYGVRGKIAADLGPNVDLLLTGEYVHRNNSFIQLFPVVAHSAFPAAHILALGYTPTFGNPILSTNNDAIDRNKGYNITAQLSWRISDAITLTSINSYRNFKEDTNGGDVDATPQGFNVKNGFRPPVPGYFGPVSIEQNVTESAFYYGYFTSEQRLNYSGDRLKVVGGIFYQTLDDHSRSNFTAAVTNPLVPLPAGAYVFTRTTSDNHLKDDTWAVFGDVTWKATDTVSLFGGLRYTHEAVALTYHVNQFTLGRSFYVLIPAVNLDPNTGQFTGGGPKNFVDFVQSRSADNVSGRIGVQWEPTAGTNFYASYNRGYKGPGADTSFSAAPGAAVIDPEIGESFELGTKLKLLDNRVLFNLNVFRERIHNVQQSLLVPGTTTIRPLNAGTLKSDGVEIEARALLAKGFSVDGSVVYNHARYEGKFANGTLVTVPCYSGQTAAQGCTANGEAIAGQQARGSYKWRFNVGASYELDAESLPFLVNAMVNYAWYDRANVQLGSDPLQYHPSYGNLDASIGFRSRNGRYAVDIFGKNLTNEFRYGQLGSADGIIGRVYGSVPRDYKRYGGVRVTVGF